MVISISGWGLSIVFSDFFKKDIRFKNGSLKNVINCTVNFNFLKNEPYLATSKPIYKINPQKKILIIPKNYAKLFSKKITAKLCFKKTLKEAKIFQKRKKRN
jgi:hypothetical protein